MVSGGGAVKSLMALGAVFALCACLNVLIFGGPPAREGRGGHGKLRVYKSEVARSAGFKTAASPRETTVQPAGAQTTVQPAHNKDKPKAVAGSEKPATLPVVLAQTTVRPAGAQTTVQPAHTKDKPKAASAPRTLEEGMLWDKLKAASAPRMQEEHIDWEIPPAQRPWVVAEGVTRIAVSMPTTSHKRRYTCTFAYGSPEWDLPRDPKKKGKPMRLCPLGFHGFPGALLDTRDTSGRFAYRLYISYDDTDDVADAAISTCAFMDNTSWPHLVGGGCGRRACG
jgi:hypothetical protein